MHFAEQELLSLPDCAQDPPGKHFLHANHQFLQQQPERHTEAWRGRSRTPASPSPVSSPTVLALNTAP